MNKILGLLYIASMVILFVGAIVSGWNQEYAKGTFFMVSFHLLAWWLNKALEDKAITGK